jgi:DNA-binding NarL/FixJ family response regulator
MALSVMIVDDDEPFLALAVKILAGCGYHPESEARSVSDALSRVARHPPDLALVDIGLPDGNGMELSKQLTDAPLRVRVVLISADSDATSQRGAMDVGAIGFIPKSDLSCSTLDALLRTG